MVTAQSCWHLELDMISKQPYTLTLLIVLIRKANATNHY